MSRRNVLSIVVVFSSVVFSSIGFLGCEPALQGGSPMADEPADEAEPQALPSPSLLCGVKSDENGNPQSRSYRGGCLGNFGHFYTDDSITPPEPLPARVIGYHYMIGDMEVRVTSANPEGAGAGDGATPLYDVRLLTSEGEINPCAGERRASCVASSCFSEVDERAVAVPGAWDVETGAHYETAGDKRVFTLACMSGVAAKCVQWGYPPWDARDGEPLSDYYQACVKAARAQYDGSTSHTCSGAVIHVSDRLGIQPPVQDTEALPIEAAWGKDGPLCISHPRFPACAEAPSVQGIPACDDAALAGGADGWPEGVLLVTQSTGDYQARMNRCPVEAGVCN